MLERDSEDDDTDLELVMMMMIGRQMLGRQTTLTGVLIEAVR